MDQFTRRIIGLGVQAGIVDGVALCRMFLTAVRGKGLPSYLRSDHAPLYRFYQWQANLRMFEVAEIKTVPGSAAFASFCRATDPYYTARVLGSDSVLEHGRLGGQAMIFNITLLQIARR
jgi:hypothetical protein